MKTFESLLLPAMAIKGDTWDTSIVSHEQHQQNVADILPIMLAEVGLPYWRHGQDISQAGRRILFGIAPWSKYDLMFLDEMADAIRAGRTTDALIEVFSIDDACSTIAEFMQYYPVEPQYPFPCAGLWVDGVFESIYEGHTAKAFIRSELGMPACSQTSRVPRWLRFLRRTNQRK